MKRLIIRSFIGHNYGYSNNAIPRSSASGSFIVLEAFCAGMGIDLSCFTAFMPRYSLVVSQVCASFQ